MVGMLGFYPSSRFRQNGVHAHEGRRLRSQGPATGDRRRVWIQLDSPASTERVARLGYDYVSLDAQHGLFGYSGMLAALTAIDAAGRAVGLVRVAANDATAIGRALDAGAAGVISPLVNTSQDAAVAVAASRYPPVGIRSYGPTRASMRIGPAPATPTRPCSSWR